MRNRILSLNAQIPDETSLLVTDPINIRYLSGFTGSFGYLLVNSQATILFTDSRYTIQSEQETTDINIVIGRDVKDFISDYCSTKNLLVEGNHINLNFFNTLSQLSNIDCKPSTALVEKLRVIKDRNELTALRRAGEITTTALHQLLTQKLWGRTEREVANQLHRLMIDAGAHAIAFDSIVASGPNSAIPHHQPTERIIETGDFLKIDFGAEYAGYKSDCTRTFVIGQPDEFQRDLYSQVRKAQQAGRDIVSAGIAAMQIDEQVRKVLASAQYSDTFQHGLGHGVGLAIHEDPFLSAKNDTRLASGTVVTIEPGMYVAGRGGVRIEDTIVITDDGYQNLTDFSHELISL